MRTLFRPFIGVLLSLAAMPAIGFTYRVGADARCSFGDLQDAINAAANNPGEDFIRVASNRTYTNMSLRIGRQDLTITGGYRDCRMALGSSPPGGSTILDGTGGASAPVISISDNGVRVLRNLQIRSGDNVQNNGTGCGGGIKFDGRGELVIVNTGVSNNRADSGGGICFVSDAGAQLTLGSQTVLTYNEAVTGNGGGVLVHGFATLNMRQDRSVIAYNRALNGLGGGVYLRAPADANIGSPGYNGIGVIYANEAKRGGGIALEAPEEDDPVWPAACLRLYTTDAHRPVRVQSNRASEYGGGIYLRSNQGGVASLGRTEVSAVMFGVRIDDNRAPNGPAAFLSGDPPGVLSDGVDARLLFNPSESILWAPCGLPLDEPFVACTNAAECNRVENNIAEDFSGSPSNGNIIEVRDGAFVSADRITMRGNRGTRLLSTSGEQNFSVWLNQCALIDNVLSGDLFRAFTKTSARLVDCTVAGNRIGAASVMHFDEVSSLTLVRSIIDQPGKTTTTWDEGLYLGGDHVLATEVASIASVSTSVLGQARFINPVAGDYRQRVGSRGVDFVSYSTPEIDVDMDHRPRNVDLGTQTANDGIRDLGAYERQESDPWLQNPHFEQGLQAWYIPNPTIVTWNGEFNAPVSVGGSMVLHVPAEQASANDRRVALSQCFNVPSPGNYQINALALVSAARNNRDYPMVSWSVRYDDGDCSGGSDGDGQTFMGRSGSTWQGPMSPVVVHVDAARWNWNTTLEVRLEAAQDSAAVTLNALFARFDAVEVQKLP
jgi:hypothetical protein